MNFPAVAFGAEGYGIHSRLLATVGQGPPLCFPIRSSFRFHNPFTLTVAHGGGEQDGLGTASDSGCSLQDSPVPTPPSSSGKLSPHLAPSSRWATSPTVSISRKSTRLMLLSVAASAGTRSDRRRGDQGDVKPRKWLVGDHGGKNPPSADPSYLPGRTGRVSCSVNIA